MSFLRYAEYCNNRENCLVDVGKPIIGGKGAMQQLMTTRFLVSPAI